MKKLLLILSINLLTTSITLAQNNDYTTRNDSEGNELLPQAKGKINLTDAYDEDFVSTLPKNIIKLYETKLQEFTNALAAHKMLNPPTGFEVNITKWIDDANRYSTNNNEKRIVASLQFTIAPYYKIDGEPIADFNINSGFYLFLNNPSKMAGDPIISDIYLCPKKVDSFCNYPVYATNRQEVTIINFSGKPLFVPVSQEEYIHTLIAYWEQKINDDQKDKEKYIDDVNNLTSNDAKKKQKEEFERTYNELLKYDKNAAEELKKTYEETLTTIENFNEEDNIGDNAFETSIALNKSQIEKLKAELAAMTDAEKKRQAYYAVGASDGSAKISDLLPESQKELGDALVRINPELLKSDTDKIEIVCIQWHLLNREFSDKPRLVEISNTSDWFIDDKILTLYLDSNFWNNVFSNFKKGLYK